MTTTTDMISGMTDALEVWLTDYERLYIDRAPAGLLTPAEVHARHMEETGLLGRAHTILFTLAANIRRAEIGLDAEGYPVPAPSVPPAGFRLRDTREQPAIGEGGQF